MGNVGSRAEQCSSGRRRVADDSSRVAVPVPAIRYRAAQGQEQTGDRSAATSAVSKVRRTVSFESTLVPTPGAGAPSRLTSLLTRSLPGLRLDWRDKPSAVPACGRPWSRNSRRRWRQSTLDSEFRLSRTCWPVSRSEALFLPHFPVDGERASQYRRDRYVANGAFGRVYQVTDETTGDRFALKVLGKSQIIAGNAARQLKDEVDIQTVCGHHPFIAQCVQFWQSKKQIFLLSPYYSKGELFLAVKSFTADLTRLYVAEIALAIDFLHNAGIIYRDLKPENILVDDRYHIKLIDFGLSKWLKIGSKTRTLCGTLQYMAASACETLADGLLTNDKETKNPTRVSIVLLLPLPTMNARSQTFDLRMEGRQVDEAVCSIFHTILLHRSLGKFMYSSEAMYSVGTIGHMDVDCDFIDFTYVCCASPSLDQKIRHEIGKFSRQLRSNDSSGAGQISLEFFQRKKTRWPFQTDCIPWEVWTIRLELLTLTNEDDRQTYRETVGDLLTEKIFYITEIINRHDYLPKTPNQTELDLVFDTSYPDVQPYMFQFKFSTAGPSGTSVGNTVKKLIKDTLLS